MPVTITKRGTFESSDGINTISFVMISPSENIKAVVQFCHGMAEHKERYLPFGEFLAQNGIAFCMHDHLGHGESASSSEALGFFGEKNGWRFLPDDAHRFTEIIKETFPGIPFFIGGHSMGSFVVRSYISLYPDSADGVIIMGSGDSTPLIKAGKVVAAIIGAVKGKRYRSKLMDKLSFGGYNSKLDNPQTPSDWLSRDAGAVKKYIADPFCGFIFTAAAFSDLTKLISFATGKKWAETVNKTTPILLISGDCDPVGDYGRGISRVNFQLISAGVRDVTLKLYDGARHEILNETNSEEVYNDIMKWLKAKL